MDVFQIGFLFVIGALILTAFVEWISWRSYWRSRQAIRDELTAIADDAERLKQDNNKPIDRLQQ